jgi:hypothetical protein
MKHIPNEKFYLSLFIDGKETPFQYEDGSIEGIRNDHANGFQRLFIMGRDCKGRFCRVGSISLPAGMVEYGGTCKMNGKSYTIKRPQY